MLGWQFPDPADAGATSPTSRHHPAASAQVEPGGSTRAQLWFVVDDIHAAVAKVRELGGSADEPVLYDSGWSADCVDDQGTTFSLSVRSEVLPVRASNCSRASEWRGRHVAGSHLSDSDPFSACDQRHCTLRLLAPRVYLDVAAQNDVAICVSRSNRCSCDGLTIRLAVSSSFN